MNQTSSIVREVMHEYGSLTHSRMLAYLPDKEPREYLYRIAADYPLRGGHGLRPSVCIASAKAFGAAESMAVTSAIAIELMHNALLIHDDIEDESELRRGTPTLHELYGMPIALNAGDTLLLLSLQPLIDNLRLINPRSALRVLELCHRMAKQTAEGQAMDLGWRRDNVFDITEQQYIAMVTKKTSWLATILPLRIGAEIGLGKKADHRRLFALGFYLGAAFQIRDDLLNLIGDESKYGKEIEGDLYEGKRTLMLLHLYQRLTVKQRQDVEAWMKLERADRKEHVCWLRSQMEHHGSIEYADGVARAMSASAQHTFAAIYGDLPPTRDSQFIHGLAEWVITRH